MIKLISPKADEVVVTLKDNVINYVDNMRKQQKKIKDDYVFNGLNWGLEDFVKVDNYLIKKNKNKYVVPVKFLFDCKGKTTLFISKVKDFSGELIKKTTSKNEIKIFNLLRNTKYYWKVESNNEISEVRSFKTSDYPRSLKFGTAPNIRDFGGYKVKDGRVIKQNLILRGCELTTETYTYQSTSDYSTQNHTKLITKSNCFNLSKLFGKDGVEMDFRGRKEANNITSSNLTNKYHQFEYFPLPIGGYDNVLTTKSEEVRANFKKAFELAANADEKPIYCHCWGGADRTGTFCFLLGALLGMSYTDLIIEYEMTSFCGNIRLHYRSFPEISWLRFKEFYDYLEAYSKTLKTNSIQETVEELLINDFDIAKDTIEKIRNIFLH